MKLNLLTNLIMALLVTSGLGFVAHADDSAKFEAQLTVVPANACAFRVTYETGTAMTATYTYSATDELEGTFGTTTLNTTEPLTVLVSTGNDNCLLGPFTVATNNPGEKIAKNTAGIPTPNSGHWPVRWLYTFMDSYTNSDGTVPSAKPTQLETEVTDDHGANYYTSSGQDPDCGAVANPTVVNQTLDNQNYGVPPYEKIPALSSAANGGHIKKSDACDFSFRASSPINVTSGMVGVGLMNDHPTHATIYMVTPSDDAVSVRIGIAQFLATFPYGVDTRAPDPLTVYDTLNGAPLTGTGTMTITAL